MSSAFVPRRSARVAADNCAAIVRSKNSDAEAVGALITAAEDKNIVVRAAAVVTLFQYLITNTTLWKTHARFQQTVMDKTIEFKTVTRRSEVPACVYDRIQELSRTLAQAIVRYRLEQAMTRPVKSF